MRNEELNGASSDSAFDPPKMYIRDVQVLSKRLLSQSVLHAEISDSGYAGFYIKSHLSFLRYMKELRSFIAACENALASKHFHCARILKSVGWPISEPEVTGISALKKRISQQAAR